MKKAGVLGTVVGIAAAGVCGYLYSRGPETTEARAATKPDPLALIPRNESSREDLRREIAKSAKDAAPKAQDRVGRARLQLAYSEATAGDFKAARATFLTAAKEYKGTGAMSPDFGGIPDQAAYQAAVCLVAEGRTAEAEGEFVRFLRERPESPLVHAAHRRLARLNGGETKPEHDALLQAAIVRQERRIRFETSVCGPKAIEYLLPRLGKPARTYVEIAKLCGTTDAGTSMEGMRRGLERLGVDSFAYRLNRRDLATAPLPFILLQGDHYVAVLEVQHAALRLYDSRFASERTEKLPALDDPDFSATLILFRKPETQP